MDATGMILDQTNTIVRLCAEGMELEGAGKPREAAAVFEQAWRSAANDVDKFIAAHYLARHQPDVAGKLHWDTLALKETDGTVRQYLPSLYLNIGKCHEDLGDLDATGMAYQEGKSYEPYLPSDGYGNMIRAGLEAGLKRINE